MLEIAFEALENANMLISKIKGSYMGVFIAAGMDEGYIKLLFTDKGWGGLCLISRLLYTLSDISSSAYTRFYGTGIAKNTACGQIS